MSFDKTKYQPNASPTFVEDYRTGEIVGYVKRDGSYGNLPLVSGEFNPTNKALTASTSAQGIVNFMAGGRSVGLQTYVRGSQSPHIIDGGTDTGVVRPGGFSNMIGSSWTISEGTDSEGFYVQAVYTGTGSGVLGAAFPTALDLTSGGYVDWLVDLEIPGDVTAPGFTLLFSLSNNASFSNSASRTYIFNTGGLIGALKPGRNILFARTQSLVTAGVDGSTATGYFGSTWSINGTYTTASPITHMGINALSGALPPAGTKIRLRPGGVRQNCINTPSLIFGLDDGHKSAYPVYKLAAAYGLRGVLPIVGSFIGNNNYMTLAQIRELEALGFTPINHSWSHVNMAGWTYQQAYDDIKRMRDFMSDNNLGDGRIYNYPGGIYSNNVVQAVKDLGFQFGRAAGKDQIRVSPIFGIENPYRIGSVDMSGANNLQRVKNIIKRMSGDAASEIVWLYGHQVLEGNPAEDAATPGDTNLWYFGWYRQLIYLIGEQIAKGKIRPLSAKDFIDELLL